MSTNNSSTVRFVYCFKCCTTDIMDSLKLYTYFDNCSVKELQRTKLHLEKLIKEKMPDERIFIDNLNVDDFVEYRSSFISEAESDAITKSLKSHDTFKSATKTTSLWLSRTSESYAWSSVKSGTVYIHKAVPITNFPPADVMLDKVNLKLGTDFNSCLVQYYPDNASGVRIHDDFEFAMDNTRPIAVVSTGATRTVEFFHNFQTTSETPAKAISVQSESMYVMKVGCQEYYRHRVPATKEHTSDRFSFSFRRILSHESTNIPCADRVVPGPVRPLTAPKMVDGCTSPVPQLAVVSVPEAGTSPVKSHINFFEQYSQTSPAVPTTVAESITPVTEIPNVQTSPRDRKITLLFGTSVTRWVKPGLLSDADTEFINVSHSGAHIKNRSHGQRVPDFGEMLENFAATNTDKVPRVEHVIVSLGTNDIKHYRVDNGRGRLATPGNVSKFWDPIVDLVNSLRKHFGANVRIYFTSVLPMKVMYTYTARNFLSFNRLLQEICRNMQCGYLDWFDFFLDPDGNDYNKHLYADPIHLNRAGYDLLHNVLKYAIDADWYMFR